MSESRYLVKCFDVDRNVVMHVICPVCDLSDIVDMCKGKTFVSFVKVIVLNDNSEVNENEI